MQWLNSILVHLIVSAGVEARERRISLNSGYAWQLLLHVAKLVPLFYLPPCCKATDVSCLMNLVRSSARWRSETWSTPAADQWCTLGRCNWEEFALHRVAGVKRNVVDTTKQPA